MNLQRRTAGPAHLALADNCIYLARDGSMRPHAKSAEFFRSALADPALREGRVLALHHVNGPRDVHYPTWEMHPEGDELLILVSGSVSVEFGDEQTQQAAPLPPRSAFIVPAGTWHRLVVNAPSVLLAITPRHNTVHEKTKPARSHS